MFGLCCQKVHSAKKDCINAFVPGVKKCHSLVRLNQTGVDFAVELGAQQLLRCIGYLDTLEWKPDTGRQIMERISTLMVFIIIATYKVTEYN